MGAWSERCEGVRAWEVRKRREKVENETGVRTHVEIDP